MSVSGRARWIARNASSAVRSLSGQTRAGHDQPQLRLAVAQAQRLDQPQLHDARPQPWVAHGAQRVQAAQQGLDRAL